MTFHSNGIFFIILYLFFQTCLTHHVLVLNIIFSCYWLITPGAGDTLLMECLLLTSLHHHTLTLHHLPTTTAFRQDFLLLKNLKDFKNNLLLVVPYNTLHTVAALLMWRTFPPMSPCRRHSWNNPCGRAGLLLSVLLTPHLQHMLGIFLIITKLVLLCDDVNTHPCPWLAKLTTIC